MLHRPPAVIAANYPAAAYTTAELSRRFLEAGRLLPKREGFVSLAHALTTCLQAACESDGTPISGFLAPAPAPLLFRYMDIRSPDVEKI
jgi:hypothetical protein